MNPPQQLSSVAEQPTVTFHPEFATSRPLAVERRPLPLELPRREGFYERLGKRAFDLIGASILLILTAPILAVAAVAIKLDSRGSVLFQSWRCGKGGRQFRFYKLRSMFNGAHQARSTLMHLNEMDGPVFKLARDPRITRCGRILRRSSIDELPQLWNVITGDMSLVGPRPPIPEEVEQYSPSEMQRLSVKPGLTCLWQVSGRSTLGFDEWMALDIEYIRRRSFWLDLKILLLTVPAVLSCRGAY